MKKGRHRRYEEARALKRGPDLDIDALFTDLGGDPLAPSDRTDTDAESRSEDLDDDLDDDGSWDYPDEDDED